MASDRDHVILSHGGRCPEHNREEVRLKVFLRKLTDQDRIQYMRGNLRRNRKPPQFVKERYACPHAAVGQCALVREDPAACPVYQEYHYSGFVE